MEKFSKKKFYECMAYIVNHLDDMQNAIDMEEITNEYYTIYGFKTQIDKLNDFTEECLAEVVDDDDFADIMMNSLEIFG